MGLGRTLLEPPPRSPRHRSGRFVNYSGTVDVQPRRWHVLSDETQVSALVADAAATGRRIRVIGAGHSWSPIAAPEDMAVTLDDLAGIVARGDGWVRVRAGTRLGDLNQDLSEFGQTLPIVGSITQQSVGGAIGTATHGSSLRHGNLSSLVLGARLITGDGEPLEVGEKDERLDAVRAHLGALGILTEVVLQTTPAFSLAETVQRIPVHEVAARAEEMGRSAEYVKVWWMPHTPDALCFRYDRTTEPMTRWPSPETQRVVENWFPRAVLPPLFAWHEQRPGGVPQFNRLATRILMKRRRVGPSGLMLTTPYPIRHHETEAAVPLAAGGEAFERSVRVIERLNLRVNFILELRYVQGDTGWMSPAYQMDAAQVGACTARTEPRHAYFDAFWEEMRRMGGRPHWAKEMDHESSEIRALFPMADRFIALRDELDPKRVFANSFLEQVLGP